LKLTLSRENVLNTLKNLILVIITTKPIISNRNTQSYVINTVVSHFLIMITADSGFLEFSKLFNLMLSVHCVPLGFKFSYIVPIPKPKDCYSKPLKCDDFRGIAISPILSKVFEYCLLEKCNYFLKTSDTQFGF